MALVLRYPWPVLAAKLPGRQSPHLNHIPMFTARRPRPLKQLAGLLLVVLVHAGFYLALQASRHPPAVDHELTPGLVVHWVAAQPEAVPREAPRGERARIRGNAPPQRPTAEPGPSTPETKAAVEAVVETVTQGPARLNLSLPVARPASGPQAQSLASLVRDDARSHSEKHTMEWAIADAAGTLPVTVQTSTDGLGSQLIRQGSKCTRVSQPRIATLNPMDESTKGLPAMSGPCVR